MLLPAYRSYRARSGPSRGADLQLGAYLGPAYTMPSGVKLTQPGGTDIRFHDVPWEGKPFKPPPYYGLRAIYWLPSSKLALMGDFTHVKARALSDSTLSQTGTRDGLAVPARERLSATLGRLEFTHGYNLLTLNVVRRGSVSKAGLVPYAGIGLGVAYPHIEVQRTGVPRESRTFEYQFAGPAMQVLGGIEWRFGRRLSLFLEYKLSCRDQRRSGGRRNHQNQSLHASRSWPVPRSICGHCRPP